MGTGDFENTEGQRIFLRTGKGKPAEIAAILERRIRSKTYDTGYRFPGERVLAEEFGVSRNTIRSARKVLESRNLVETKWGSGTVVLEADKAARNMVLKLSKAQHEWKNVMQLRDLVEPHIVELAAVTASASDLITLGDLIDRTNPHMLPEESLNLDMTFHLALAQSTGNPLIEALLGFVNDSTRKVRLHTHETYAKRELSLQGHARIFDCIRHGDSQGAGQAMQRHLREVGEFAL